MSPEEGPGTAGVILLVAAFMGLVLAILLS